MEPGASGLQTHDDHHGPAHDHSNRFQEESNLEPQVVKGAHQEEQVRPRKRGPTEDDQHDRRDEMEDELRFMPLEYFHWWRGCCIQPDWIRQLHLAVQRSTPLLKLLRTLWRRARTTTLLRALHETAEKQRLFLTPLDALLVLCDLQGASIAVFGCFFIDMSDMLFTLHCTDTSCQGRPMIMLSPIQRVCSVHTLHIPDGFVLENFDVDEWKVLRLLIDSSLEKLQSQREVLISRFLSINVRALFDPEDLSVYNCYFEPPLFQACWQGVRDLWPAIKPEFLLLEDKAIENPDHVRNLLDCFSTRQEVLLAAARWFIRSRKDMVRCVRLDLVRWFEKVFDQLCNSGIDSLSSELELVCWKDQSLLQSLICKIWAPELAMFDPFASPGHEPDDLIQSQYGRLQLAVGASRGDLLSRWKFARMMALLGIPKQKEIANATTADDVEQALEQVDRLNAASLRAYGLLAFHLGLPLQAARFFEKLDKDTRLCTVVAPHLRKDSASLEKIYLDPDQRSGFRAEAAYRLAELQSTSEGKLNWLFKATQADPEFDEPWFVLGRWSTNKTSMLKPIQDLFKPSDIIITSPLSLLQKAPRHRHALRLQIDHHRKNSDKKSEKECLKFLIELGDSSAVLELGDFYLRDGKKSEAKMHYERGDHLSKYARLLRLADVEEEEDKLNRQREKDFNLHIQQIEQFQQPVDDKVSGVCV